MAELPTGTVTFLFTDIEGSTRLWEQQPAAMREALERHDALLRRVIASHAGYVFKTIGDQFCAALATAPQALAAALTAQRALGSAPCGASGGLRVRMALHTGAALQRDQDYFGPALNRVARLLVVGHGGQILLSQAAAEAARGALPAGARLRDLGSHRLKDLQQPERLFQLLHPDLPADFPPLRSLEALAHNLPAQLTSFIGRDREMAAIKALLGHAVSRQASAVREGDPAPAESREPRAGGLRLLTLTGTGGCGKTRLALQVAADLLGEYPDGVWLVELAALADPTLVPQTLAAALGVREEPGRPLTATLTDYLRPKQVLLVPDNCEHLLAACAPLVDALLRACPQLRVLATSREALGVAGEQTYRVPSLSLPPALGIGDWGLDVGTGPTARTDRPRTPDPQPPMPNALLQSEAVQLFADRARLSQATFAVTEQNARAVAQVCQRLDGIPLAIELAAARVQALSVEQIHERLDDMFRLLTRGSRTALPRQQTLRALIDWSYDLLSEPERTLLRRISVFAGGWTLAAAEAVCKSVDSGQWIVDRAGAANANAAVQTGPPTNHHPPSTDVLDLLTSLVNKSLVTYEEQSEEGRYRLLETVRQYARDRLQEAGEGAAVRERHRDWFLALAEDGASLDQLEREHDNLRAALEWSLHQPPTTAVEKGLRLGAALGGLWNVRGYWTEGRERMAGLLALRGAQARTALRTKVLSAAGLLAYLQWDARAARALYEESLEILRDLGDRQGSAHALGGLANIARQRGDFGSARTLYEESLGIFRELADKHGIAWSLGGIGNVTLDQGDLATARALFEESLGIFRELQDPHGMAYALGGLGNVTRDQGDAEIARALFAERLATFREVGSKEGMAYSLGGLAMVAQDQGEFGAAQALWEESLAIFRKGGDKVGLAVTLKGLGLAARDQGEFEAARALLEESLGIFRELNHPRGIAPNLEGWAGLAAAQGQAERAARLFGAADGLRAAISLPLPPADRAGRDRFVATVRIALGEAAWAAAWAEGRALSLDAAISYALAASEGPEDDRNSRTTPGRGAV